LPGMRFFPQAAAHYGHRRLHLDHTRTDQHCRVGRVPPAPCGLRATPNKLQQPALPSAVYASRGAFAMATMPCATAPPPPVRVVSQISLRGLGGGGKTDRLSTGTWRHRQCLVIRRARAAGCRARRMSCRLQSLVEGHGSVQSIGMVVATKSAWSPQPNGISMRKAKNVTTPHPRSVDARDAEIGRLVRAQRQQLRLPQTDLAERVDVTFQQVQKYEKGMNRISIGRLTRIAEALDVPPTFFFARDGHALQA
jgi:hypothetical protein